MWFICLKSHAIRIANRPSIPLPVYDQPIGAFRAIPYARQSISPPPKFEDITAERLKEMINSDSAADPDAPNTEADACTADVAVQDIPNAEENLSEASTNDHDSEAQYPFLTIPTNSNEPCPIHCLHN